MTAGESSSEEALTSIRSPGRGVGRCLLIHAALLDRRRATRDGARPELRRGGANEQLRANQEPR